MDHLSPGVEALVDLEHKTIVDKYGNGYHSAHEGHAVLREEVEEAKEQLAYVEATLHNLWQSVRADDPPDRVITRLHQMEHYAKQLAAEAVQVAAVARRWRGGVKGENA